MNHTQHRNSPRSEIFPRRLAPAPPCVDALMSSYGVYVRCLCARLAGPARRRPPGDCGVWRRTGRSRGRLDRGRVVVGGRRRPCGARQ
eukprot:1834065-Prymnesium_polylepis.2